jgi:RNA polymerase sigma-70 factor (ECF subfamily)
VPDSPESEEIAADSMIKLFSRYYDFESLSNIRAFLFITTRNSCFNFLSYAERENSEKEDLTKMNEAEQGQLILTEMIHAEIVREIYKEIEQLPRACREVFELLYLEGKKAKEVAEQLNISINTVWSQRQEAIRLLRTTLLKKGILSMLLAYGSWGVVA